MKNQKIAQQLLASMARHGDTKRFISDCSDKAYRFVEIGHDDTTTAFIFHFPDGSRVEFDPADKYIRAFSSNEHFA